MWFRASELKHGRVAMLASVGYLAGAAGVTFPGEIAKGVTFESVNANGVFSAWSNVPEQGKLQVCSSQSRQRAAVHQHRCSSRSSSRRAEQRGGGGETVAAAHITITTATCFLTLCCSLAPLTQILMLIFPELLGVEEAALHARRRPRQDRVAAPDGIQGIWAPKIGLGSARLHRRLDRGAEGEEAEGRAQERPPRDDWHHPFLVGHNLPGAVPALNSAF